MYKIPILKKKIDEKLFTVVKGPITYSLKSKTKKIKTNNKNVSFGAIGLNFLSLISGAFKTDGNKIKYETKIKDVKKFKQIFETQINNSTKNFFLDEKTKQNNFNNNYKLRLEEVKLVNSDLVIDSVSDMYSSLINETELKNLVDNTLSSYSTLLDNSMLNFKKDLKTDLKFDQNVKVDTNLISDIINSMTTNKSMNANTTILNESDINNSIDKEYTNIKKVLNTYETKTEIKDMIENKLFNSIIIELKNVSIINSSVHLKQKITSKFLTESLISNEFINKIFNKLNNNENFTFKLEDDIKTDNSVIYTETRHHKSEKLTDVLFVIFYIIISFILLYVLIKLTKN